ncbi:hypothetical protein HYV84_01080 [Candidatus Woesearchaeota archaeon]|nr:hypothetical protein [Candidatus Woesearchaeota archaeon]
MKKKGFIVFETLMKGILVLIVLGFGIKLIGSLSSNPIQYLLGFGDIKKFDQSISERFETASLEDKEARESVYGLLYALNKIAVYNKEEEGRRSKRGILPSDFRTFGSIKVEPAMFNKRNVILKGNTKEEVAEQVALNVLTCDTIFEDGARDNTRCFSLDTTQLPEKDVNGNRLIIGREDVAKAFLRIRDTPDKCNVDLQKAQESFGSITSDQEICFEACKQRVRDLIGDWTWYKPWQLFNWNNWHWDKNLEFGNKFIKLSDTHEISGFGALPFLSICGDNKNKNEIHVTTKTEDQIDSYRQKKDNICEIEKIDQAFGFVVHDFSLPQESPYSGNWAKDTVKQWLGAYGNPKYMLYYEQFPKGEDVYWEPNAYGVAFTTIVGIEIGGALVGAGLPYVGKAFVWVGAKIIPKLTFGLSSLWINVLQPVLIDAGRYGANLAVAIVKKIPVFGKTAVAELDKLYKEFFPAANQATKQAFEDLFIAGKQAYYSLYRKVLANNMVEDYVQVQADRTVARVLKSLRLDKISPEAVDAIKMQYRAALQRARDRLEQAEESFTDEISGKITSKAKNLINEEIENAFRQSTYDDEIRLVIKKVIDARKSILSERIKAADRELVIKANELVSELAEAERLGYVLKEVEKLEKEKGIKMSQGDIAKFMGQLKKQIQDSMDGLNNEKAILESELKGLTGKLDEMVKFPGTAVDFIEKELPQLEKRGEMLKNLIAAKKKAVLLERDFLSSRYGASQRLKDLGIDESLIGKEKALQQADKLVRENINRLEGEISSMDVELGAVSQQLSEVGELASLKQGSNHMLTALEQQRASVAKVEAELSPKNPRLLGNLKFSLKNNLVKDMDEAVLRWGPQAIASAYRTNILFNARNKLRELAGGLSVDERAKILIEILETNGKSLKNMQESDMIRFVLFSKQNQQIIDSIFKNGDYIWDDILLQKVSAAQKGIFTKQIDDAITLIVDPKKTKLSPDAQWFLGWSTRLEKVAGFLSPIQNKRHVVAAAAVYYALKLEDQKAHFYGVGTNALGFKKVQSPPEPLGEDNIKGYLPADYDAMDSQQKQEWLENNFYPKIENEGGFQGLLPEVRDFYISLTKDKSAVWADQFPDRFHLVSPCYADLFITVSRCTCYGRPTKDMKVIWFEDDEIYRSGEYNGKLNQEVHLSYNRKDTRKAVYFTDKEKKIEGKYNQMLYKLDENDHPVKYCPDSGYFTIDDEYHPKCIKINPVLQYRPQCIKINPVLQQGIQPNYCYHGKSIALSAAQTGLLYVLPIGTSIALGTTWGGTCVAAGVLAPLAPLCGAMGAFVGGTIAGIGGSLTYALISTNHQWPQHS